MRLLNVSPAVAVLLTPARGWDFPFAEARPVLLGQTKTYHLVFHGGSAAYSLSVPTNGIETLTGNDLSISQITVDSPEVFTNCRFSLQGYTVMSIPSTPQLRGTPTLFLGPPRPIHAVTCFDHSIRETTTAATTTTTTTTSSSTKPPSSTTHTPSTTTVTITLTSTRGTTTTRATSTSSSEPPPQPSSSPPPGGCIPPDAPCADTDVPNAQPPSAQCCANLYCDFNTQRCVRFFQSSGSDADHDDGDGEDDAVGAGRL